MIPYESNLATAVPKVLVVRLAIIRAIGRLNEPCDSERVQLRRAEIASLRHKLEGIAQDLRKLSREWPFLIRSELRKAGFDPNEPRVPAGHSDGGQWTGDSGGPPLAIQKSFPMRPIPTGYRAPNTPPTATIGFQELSTENIRFSRKPRRSLKRPPLDRSPMTASIGGPWSIGITTRPSMRPSPTI